MTASSSAVRRTSNSKPSQPSASARSNEARVFSGIDLQARAPRWPRRSGRLMLGGSMRGRSVEIEVANRLARVGSLFRLLQRLLEFLLQQVGSVLLSFYRLLENRFAAVVLFAHGLGRGLHITEGLRLHGSGVGDDGAGCRIYFEHRAAAGAGHFEVGGFLRHVCESYRKTGVRGQGPGVRGQRSEARGQRSEARGQGIRGRMICWQLTRTVAPER